MKQKIQFSILVAIVLVVIAIIVLQPTPDPSADDYHNREEQLSKRIKEMAERIDSLQTANKTMVDGYRRLYKDFELAQDREKEIRKKYEKLKNRPYRVYNDAEIDSILSARYGDN